MKIAVYGSGGREHALTDAFVTHGHEVTVFPGNPGMAQVACVADQQFEEIEADLYVIGPEAPLVDGMADRLRSRGRLVVGPGRDGAQLEGSKAWMKEILLAAGIPTASFKTFNDQASAIEYLNSYPGPYVIKTDGLAAGKGVLVTTDRKQAIDDVCEKLSGHAFGAAGSTVVIEEAMQGPEISVLVLCDGKKGFPLPSASDFKRIYDDDKGPNTGGMGAFSPVPFVDDALIGQIMEESVDPLIAEFLRRGIDYRGILYAGLMITETGPKIVEFNIRFGDPETQVVVPRIKNDLAQMLLEVAQGNLVTKPEVVDDAVVTVVLAAEGYPTNPQYGATISIQNEQLDGNVRIFHAGTKVSRSGDLLVSGGRVIDVTAIGPSLNAARELAYQSIPNVNFNNMQFRSDIALRACGGNDD